MPTTASIMGPRQVSVASGSCWNAPLEWTRRSRLLWPCGERCGSSERLRSQAKGVGSAANRRTETEAAAAGPLVVS